MMHRSGLCRLKCFMLFVFGEITPHGQWSRVQRDEEVV